MDWTATITGIGGLAVAAFSLWLNYKARSRAHREHFYQKQVDAYLTVVNALHPLYNSCQNYIVLNHHKLNSASRIQFRMEMSQGSIAEDYRKFHETWRSNSLLLPASMQEQVSAFTKVLNAISAPDEIANQYPHELVYSDDPGMDLSNAYTAIIKVARQGLGVEPLSNEILKMLGGVKSIDEEATTIQKVKQ